MRQALVLAAIACLAGAAPAAASTGGSRGPLRVTFVGDSVAASITYVGAARERLSRGLSVRLDLEVCRRLVQPSCAWHGDAPPTALEAIRSYGTALGRVVIVDVGYNESAQGYREGIDRVMRAALAQGATGVVWVTLHEGRPLYRWTNVAIRTAAKRWPRLVVADWNAYSAGRPWFRDDELHLNAAGAAALASFLRPYVARAAALSG